MINSSSAVQACASSELCALVSRPTIFWAWVGHFADRVAVTGDTPGPTCLRKFMARTSRRLAIRTVVNFVVTRRSDARIQAHPTTAAEREHCVIFQKDSLYLVERFGRGARV